MDEKVKTFFLYTYIKRLYHASNSRGICFHFVLFLKHIIPYYIPNLDEEDDNLL